MTQAEALNILKTGANVFLTGEPGSGKTHTVNSFVAYLREHGIEPAITASTGIAATHIGGSTLHSWSGIGIKKFLSEYDLDAIASSEYVAPRLFKAKILIIDEVSMLGKNTLDMVDAVCREVRHDPRPFGGLQVVCVGDFFQLPPVVKGEEASGFAFESDAWQRLGGIVCYLSEQHRQDDAAFLSVLSAIRKRNIEKPHLELLQNRTDDHHDLPKEITQLFPHNMNVDTINEAELEKIEGESKIFQMTSKGRDLLVATLKKGCLSPECLVLKVGAAVMFTKNSREGGFTNGTLGVVAGFDHHTQLPIVRMKNNRKIIVDRQDWSIMDDGKVKASISQIPLRLAWAITIHKSQGMSFDAAVMDLSNVFEYGQGYVALSRVRRLSGLYLLGTNDKTFEVHPQIFEKDKEFRKLSEEAADAFAKIAAEELAAMHDNFIKFSGGSKTKGVINALKKDKVATSDITLQFWKDGKAIAEIAKAREMTLGTILGHIEKLVQEEKIKRHDVLKHCSAKLSPDLPKIHAAFRKLGAYSLKPVVEHFKNKYSYEDLKMARILFTE